MAMWREFIDLRGIGVRGRRSGRRQPLELAAAYFPGAAEGDPEGQEDQADIQAEALHANVDLVVPELVAARDIARRVNLRDASETGTHAASLLEPGHVLERDMLAVTQHFDLAGAQRTRSDEAHVAAEDAEQLRQLVHRRRAQPVPDTRNSRIAMRGLQRA